MQLEGMRVLDLSIWRPGPYATQLLTELGAQVVKIEPPGGDPMRVFPELFEPLNAGKRSEVVDLKAPGGTERVLTLAAEAHVFVEGFRPGVADRLGVGPGAVMAASPAIVYCSVSGFGQTGALRDVTGHDVSYQAYSGALSPSPGDPPAVSKVPWADLVAGLTAAFAITAAWSRASRTGAGERVDVSMADVLATFVGAVDEGVGVAGSGERMQGVAGSGERMQGVAGSGERMQGAAGYGVFATADGRHLALSVITEDHFWAPLCEQLGLTDISGLTAAERRPRANDLQARLAAAIAERPLGDLLAALQPAGVPAAPVLHRAEMLRLPHFLDRGTVTTGALGQVAVGHPVRYEHTPAVVPGPAPTPGQHDGLGFA